MDQSIAKRKILRLIRDKGYARGSEIIQIHAVVTSLTFREIRVLADQMVAEGFLTVKEGPAPMHRRADFYQATKEGMRFLRESDSQTADKGELQP